MDTGTLTMNPAFCFALTHLILAYDYMSAIGYGDKTNSEINIKAPIQYLLNNFSVRLRMDVLNNTCACFEHHWCNKTVSV